MRWFPSFTKEDKNFISFIQNTMKELEKEPYKAIIVYNDQWLPIYEYKDRTYFDGEFQEILQLMEDASVSIERNLKNEVLSLIKERLNYETPFVAFRYGKLLAIGIKEGELFLVAVIDELNGKVSVDKTEKALRDKLEIIKEKLQLR